MPTKVVVFGFSIRLMVVVSLYLLGINKGGYDLSIKKSF
jgi:hypothetical protein